MKHVLTSTGILALGAAALYAYDPEMTRQKTGRPWSVAATVRAFYDDNVTTATDRVRDAIDQDSFGFEVSPSVHVNLPMDQTFISLGYIYTFRWYEERDPNDTDQSHEFNAKLRHQFSPRHDVGVDDSFIYTSEPTVADRGGIVTAPVRTRTESDVLHNRGSIEDNFGLTQQIGLSFGYVNNWYDYEQKGVGSRSALLDRLEHLFRVDARYTVNPKLVALVGYNFGINSYTGDDVIDPATGPVFDPVTGNLVTAGHPAIESGDRDSYAHFVYLGADYDVSSKLRISARLGVQYTDYHELDEDAVNPYVDLHATYVYLPGSAATLGVRHTRNATDVVQAGRSGTPTLDQETTVFFGELTHQITPKLIGTLIGQYQMSTFNEGAYDDEDENMFLVGINLEYRFNRHWSAEVGYNYDMLDSDIQDGLGHDARSYDRNRVYVGVRASY